jgi:hypothetical protein
MNRKQLAAFLLACIVGGSACTPPEKEKVNVLVQISNVQLTRTGEHTLQVSMDYVLESGIKLPLPHKEVLVAPLEPAIKLAGTLPPFDLSTGFTGASLEVPADFRWEDLWEKDVCCVVSLKGLRENPTTNAQQYERISNEVRVPPPASS